MSGRRPELGELLGVNARTVARRFDCRLAAVVQACEDGRLRAERVGEDWIIDPKSLGRLFPWVDDGRPKPRRQPVALLPHIERRLAGGRR